MRYVAHILLLLLLLLISLLRLLLLLLQLSLLFSVGMNSVVIYVCHEVWRDYFPIQFAVADTHAAQLAVDIWGTAFWLGVAAVLYHKNIFIAI